jgi:hypothetical protein
MAGMSGIPGMPGIDCIAGIGMAQVAAEQGQAQPPPHAAASPAEQSSPQQPRTVEATIFNMVRFL